MVTRFSVWWDVVLSCYPSRCLRLMCTDLSWGEVSKCWVYRTKHSFTIYNLQYLHVLTYHEITLTCITVVSLCSSEAQFVRQQFSCGKTAKCQCARQDDASTWCHAPLIQVVPFNAVRELIAIYSESYHRQSINLGFYLPSLSSMFGCKNISWGFEESVYLLTKR